MGWYDGLADAPDALVYEQVWHGEHVLKRAWWWLVGMPPADELREQYAPAPFTDVEKARIREIAREEVRREKQPND